MLDVERTVHVVLVALSIAGCSTPPGQVSNSGDSAPTTVGSTSDEPGLTTDASTATATASGGGIGTSSSSGDDDPVTTMPLDDSGTTTATTNDPTTTDSASGSSGDPTTTGMETTTGEPADCHPRLVEVFYDTQGGENNEQWVKLFNPCDAEVDLADYSLGWGGANYTVGTMDLSGTIAADECFIVGGPQSDGDNAFPTIDLAQDFNPDLEKSGGTADGVALFLGSAGDITTDTIPVDAVIYGGNNSSNLLDAEGNTPDPHVGDAGDTDSIRRTEDVPPTWIVEANPMPGLCPPF